MTNNFDFVKYFRSIISYFSAVVTSVRTIKEGEEILDNYGYHYAVMPREERQRKLQSQYYFVCNCVGCCDSWPVYTGLATTAVPLPGTSPDQV